MCSTLKMVSVLIILCLAALVVSCRKQKGEAVKDVNTGTALKVSVLQSGKVLIDGNESSLQALEKHLLETKKQNGVVWYYRENPQGEPPAVAMKVMDLVVKYKIPIKLSSKSDFSDSVDEHGASHPRK